MIIGDVTVDFRGRKMSFSTFAKTCWYEYLQVIEIDGELLPPGEWLRQEIGKTTPQKTSIRFLDYGRLVFLESLGVLARTVSFGRRYTGYVVEGRGRLIALVESPEYGNAMYVFNADMPNWEETAQLTREEVFYGSYPEFICRVCHHDGWKNKVLSLVHQEPSVERKPALVRRRNGVTCRIR